MEELETPREGDSPEPEETAKPSADAPAKPVADAPAEPAEGAPAEGAIEDASSGEAPADAAEGTIGDAPAAEGAAEPELSVDDLFAGGESAPATAEVEGARLRAVLEAIVYVAEEPLTLAQIATALAQPPDRVAALFGKLVAEFEKPEHGVAIREVAGGYKMATKPEHHEAVRAFVKSLKPPLKLSLPALETLAVIAYKQPVTAPEVMEIRGVQGAGVLKTLLDRKLIAAAGRKNVIGKPILYKTTKEFLIQFGLKDLSELPSLKEFEEIRRLALSDAEPEAPALEESEPLEAAMPRKTQPVEPASEAAAPGSQAAESAETAPEAPSALEPENPQAAAEPDKEN